MPFVVIGIPLVVLMLLALVFVWCWPVRGHRPLDRLWAQLTVWRRGSTVGVPPDMTWSRMLAEAHVSVEADYASFEVTMAAAQADMLPLPAYAKSAAGLDAWVKSSVAGSRPGIPDAERDYDANFSWTDEIHRAAVVDREANRPATARLTLDSGIALPKLREYLLDLERRCEASKSGGCQWPPGPEPVGMWDYKHFYPELTKHSSGHGKLLVIAEILRSQGFAVRYMPTEKLGVDTIFRYLSVAGRPEQRPYNFTQCIGDATALAAQEVTSGESATPAGDVAGDGAEAHGDQALGGQATAGRGERVDQPGPAVEDVPGLGAGDDHGAVERD